MSVYFVQVDWLSWLVQLVQACGPAGALSCFYTVLALALDMYDVSADLYQLLGNQLQASGGGDILFLTWKQNAFICTHTPTTKRNALHVPVEN